MEINTPTLPSATSNSPVISHCSSSLGAPSRSSSSCSLHSNARYETTKHCLYVESGAATKKQIEEALNKVFASASKLLGQELKPLYLVNVVMRSEFPVGYSYVWVDDERIFYALIGRNFDGSHRIIEEEVKTEDLGAKKEIEYIYQPGQSWADYEDDEPQTKKINQEPLLTLGTYSIPPGRENIYIQVKKNNFIHENKDLDKHILEKRLLELKIEIPKEEELKCYRAYAEAPEDDAKFDRSHHILYGRVVDSDITAEDIRRYFLRFTSNPEKEWIQNYQNGKQLYGCYPVVSIDRLNKSCLVSFDRNSPEKDALFARYMTRKLILNKNGKTHTLSFEYNKIPKNGQVAFDHPPQCRDSTFIIRDSRDAASHTNNSNFNGSSPKNVRSSPNKETNGHEHSSRNGRSNNYHQNGAAWKQPRDFGGNMAQIGSKSRVQQDNSRNIAAEPRNASAVAPIKNQQTETNGQQGSKSRAPQDNGGWQTTGKVKKTYYAPENGSFREMVGK